MDSSYHRVCLSLGSNIDPAENLSAAVELLREQTTVLAVSRAWRTAAVGMSGPDFLNAAVLVLTVRSIQSLKDRVLRKIEARLGRVRSEDKYAPRTIDIDILLYDEQVVDPELWVLAHLAQPVAELLPDLTVPGSGKTLDQVARSLVQQSGITPCPDMLECI
jgi:2-amino-4-hydroxy-6-hydroxymethyldihydropteridine diphosphokinase